MKFIILTRDLLF